ncbi:hypothetical protein CR513_02872, partial [Mucuna pruriens]
MEFPLTNRRPWIRWVVGLKLDRPWLHRRFIACENWKEKTSNVVARGNFVVAMLNLFIFYNNKIGIMDEEGYLGSIVDALRLRHNRGKGKCCCNIVQPIHS